MCFFFLPSFGFKLGTGAHTLSGAESTSLRRAGSAVPRQAQPFPLWCQCPRPLAATPPAATGLSSRSHFRLGGWAGKCLSSGSGWGVHTQRCPTAPVAELHSLSLKPQPDVSTIITVAPTCGALPACQALGPTLCNLVDGGPPGSPVPGILQARTLKWVAISFSNA